MNGASSRRRRPTSASERRARDDEASAKARASSGGKVAGSMNERSESSSFTLFCTGVPVSSTRWRERSRPRRSARFEPPRLRACASSKTQHPHSLRPSHARSSRCAAESPSKYEYVVSSTSKPSSSRRSCSAYRSACGPWYLAARSDGHHARSSRSQLSSTDAGATTRWGRASPPARSAARSAISWIVLPRPMSSARMHPSSIRHISRSQLSPTSWYSFSRRPPPPIPAGCATRPPPSVDIDRHPSAAAAPSASSAAPAPAPAPPAAAAPPVAASAAASARISRWIRRLVSSHSPSARRSISASSSSPSSSSSDAAAAAAAGCRGEGRHCDCDSSSTSTTSSSP